MANPLSRIKRLVVKVGSALLVDHNTGQLKAEWLGSLVDDLKSFRNRGTEVIVVSSGAIALGKRVLGLDAKRLKLSEKQAAASVGQIALAQAWQLELQKRNLVAAQVLVTLDDTESRLRYLNAQSTLMTLLCCGAIPIINENDTVATSEIRYGDNDRLAARMASMLSADCLVLLSDIDGLYSAPPHHEDAVFIAEVPQITKEVERMAGKPQSSVGTGGMITKIEAGKIAVASGCCMIIAAGHPQHPLQRILDGERCTWFRSQATPRQARKRWIAGTLKPRGRLFIDEGAVRALQRGKSLLPAGLTEVRGRFGSGDPVSVFDSNGVELARGLVNFDSAETRKILGCKSSEVEKRLGLVVAKELIHRDNLALLTTEE